MKTLDITTSLSPVINLSEVSIMESFELACGAPMTKILIQDLTPYTGPVSIPVRVIEGMERIVDRGTVNEKQMDLI